MAQDGRILTVGASATDLDIYVTAGQNGAPVDPANIRFRIFDPTGAEAVSETSGTYITTGRYSASGAIIPNGYALGDDWQVKWDVVLPGGASGQFVENFTVALPTLSASFSSSVGNSVSSVFDRVRLDIGDPDAMIFNDGILRQTLKKAISRVNRKLGLVRISEENSFVFLVAFTSRVSTPVLTVDLLNGTITPDTDPYVDILILQMEEILLQSEGIAMQRLNNQTAGVFGSGIVNVSGDGVSVTNADGVSISTSPTRLSFRADMAKFNLKNIKDELDHAIRDLRWRLSGANGKDISIPRWGGAGNGYGPWRSPF